MIDKFIGKDYYLSNFYKREFVDESGKEWKSTEHYYMAHKATNAEDFEKVREAESPAEARKLGKEIKLRGDWEGVKGEVMKRAIRYKFGQHEDLRERLELTGEEELVEGNDWHDNEWGECRCGKCKGGGKNKLGKILMEVREEMRVGKDV